MTRPKPPRLPELAGMTEAGFNRVVAMIQPWDFNRVRWFPGLRWGPGWIEAEAEYNEWRASLPKTRNKKQRKADARKAFGALLDALPEVSGMLAAASMHFAEPGPRVMPDMSNWDFENIPNDDAEQTPLQRLQQFAADTGVPVSFEIAEKAMKGGER